MNFTGAFAVAAAVTEPDNVWMLRSGFTVLTMQTGFAMLEAGAVRGKNAIDIMLKNLLDTCFCAIGYFFCGYGLAYGNSVGWTNSFIGTSDFLMVDFENYGFMVFQYSFAAAATTIVSGSVAERIKFMNYNFFALFFTMVIYPPVAHWVWDPNGWMYQMGVIDFAGCGVVHMTGGVAAFFGALILGPRTGRFKMIDGVRVAVDQPNAHPGQSVMGTFILWWGWYGFNPGSTLAVQNYRHLLAAKVAATTTFAGASGAITGLALGYGRLGFAEPVRIVNGCLAGLVAITTPCAYVEPWESIIIGAIGAICTEIWTDLNLKWGIDDVAGASSVHLASGFWGLISAGFFVRPPSYFEQAMGTGLFWGGGGYQLGLQVMAGVVIFAWTAFWATAWFGITRALGLLRVTEDEELKGLDLVEHHTTNLLKENTGYLIVSPDEEDTPPAQALAYIRKRFARSAVEPMQAKYRPPMIKENFLSTGMTPIMRRHLSVKSHVDEEAQDTLPQFGGDGVQELF